MTSARSRIDEVAAGCSRFLYAHGRPGPAEVLATLVDEVAPGDEGDRYGEGGLVADVEEQVRVLLGAPAAVMMPTGTMAQQIALRIHADDRGRRVVAMHPSSHPLLHEEGALTELHRLDVVAVGEVDGLVRADELLAVPELAAVLVELPQRETGGQLMPFDELARLSAECRSRGVALHLDGARLWECGPAYGRPLADVVALADSTYVSLYKGLGATAGAVLLGSTDLVDAARVWRRRHGGSLPSLWPLALGARRGLARHLPRMDEYVAHARALAEALSDVVEVVALPETTLFHVLLPGSSQDVEQVLLDVSAESGVFLGGAEAGPRPGVARKEVYAGEATTKISAKEVRDLFSEVVARLTAGGAARDA